MPQNINAAEIGYEIVSASGTVSAQEPVGVIVSAPPGKVVVAGGFQVTGGTFAGGITVERSAPVVEDGRAVAWQVQSAGQEFEAQILVWAICINQ